MVCEGWFWYKGGGEISEGLFCVDEIGFCLEKYYILFERVYWNYFRLGV